MTPEAKARELADMPFEKGLEEALGLRSDDFGHDCQALLECESLCLQHFGEVALKLLQAERDKVDRLKAALEWIAGESDKPYCTYYERTLDDGVVIPTTKDIARAALKEVGEK